MSNQSYSIIWKHFEKNSALGSKLKAAGDFSLPYFVDGSDKERFDNKDSVSLNPVHLVKGLLVGYFDKPEGVDTSFAKDKTKQILEEQLEAFQSNSLEDLILDFASHLRETSGHEASLQALMTGAEIVPESNDIKYDGALDLYVCIEDGIIEDHSAGVQRLEQLLADIDASALNQDQLSNYKMILEDVQKM